MKRGKHLQNRAMTLFSEYAVRVQSAASDAEKRLVELEDRDSRRSERDSIRRQDIRKKYTGLN